VIAGFVESHIHLDKSRILDRCDCEHGTLEEAIVSVAAAKRDHELAGAADECGGLRRGGRPSRRPCRPGRRDPAMAVAEIAQPSFGLKRGRRSFSRAAATLHRP
jgi:hypothetical protein